VDRLEGAVFVRRAHGEFVHVQLAQGDRARRRQARGNRRLIGGHKAPQDLRPGGGFESPGHEDVLQANRYPGQQARVSARRQRRVDLVSACPRPVGVDQQITSQLAIQALDAVEVGLDQLAGFPLARPHPIAEIGDGGALHLRRSHG